MADDIRSLATRIRKDKDYRRQHEPGIGYVCPRADGYGGRDGVIPPGIAAQRGLIPRGMRHVTNDTVLQRARDAAEEGRPDAERYEEYYERGAREKAARQQAQSRPRPAPVRPQGEPEAPRAPARPARKPTAKPTARPAARPAPARVKPVKQAKKPAKPAPKRALRVFPKGDDGANGPDTLDGFYDGLRGVGYGTDESDGTWPADTEGNAGGGGEEVPAAPLPRVHGAAEPDQAMEPETPEDEAFAALVTERDDARRAYDELERDYAVLEERLRKAEAARHEAHDTIRVQLGAEPEKVKVGGRDVLGDVWEVKAYGHIDYSRERDECVLTVLDTATGSEILGQIQPGEVVVLTKSGRTACTYSGVCDKIYGSTDSSDFITCIRLRVKRESGQYGGTDHDGEAEQDP